MLLELECKINSSLPTNHAKCKQPANYVYVLMSIIMYWINVQVPYTAPMYRFHVPPQNILPNIDGIIGTIIYLGIKNISCL